MAYPKKKSNVPSQPTAKETSMNMSLAKDRGAVPTGNKIRSKPEFNVQSGGKSYPTTNPDFSPAPDSQKKQVEFQSGGRVKVTSPSGKQFDLSKEEYTGAFTTPQTIALDEELSKPLPTPGEQQPFGEPAPIGQDIQPAGLDALDTSTIVGGATAGAGTGAAIGALAGPIGAAVGGVLGGIGGAASAFFYSSSSERKQQVRVSISNFNDATAQMDNIIKDVNARNYSKQQARANWDNEYARVLQAQRELSAQQEKFAGEKLSKSLDDLSKINNWLRHYDQYRFEFEQAMAFPDPSRVSNIAVQPEQEVQQ